MPHFPIPDRVKHFWLLLRSGLPHLWASATVLVALVGGSVLLTVTWGLRHLVWGLITSLLIIIAVIVEGSYRDHQKVKLSTGVQAPDLQRLCDLARQGRTMRARLPEKRGFAPLPEDLTSRFADWKIEVAAALAPWPDDLEQFRGKPAYSVSLMEADYQATEIEQRTKVLQEITQALQEQYGVA